MNLVLINGHVACLKTTLSYLLAQSLGFAHVSTSVLGPFVASRDDPSFLELRNRRYSVAAKMVEGYLASNVSVVVDGTFALPGWRRQIYDLADRYGIEDVVAVTCVSSRRDVVEKRLEFRRKTPSAPDSKANTLEAYDGSISAFSPLESDRRNGGGAISRIVFDSGSFRVSIKYAHSEFATILARTIEGMAEDRVFENPLFGRRVTDRSFKETGKQRLYVAIEGMSGSGKSEQADRVSAVVRERWPDIAVNTVDEFSQDDVGEFLRSTIVNSEEFRVRSHSVSVSHLDCLLVLADALERVASGTASQPPSLSVFDGFRLSHIVHAIALLPDDSGRQLKHLVEVAIKRLDGSLLALPGKLLTVLLEIPQEVAASRLSNRLRRPLNWEQRQFLQRMDMAFARKSVGDLVTMRVDATQKIEAVTTDIVDLLAPYLDQIALSH